MSSEAVVMVVYGIHVVGRFKPVDKVVRKYDEDTGQPYEKVERRDEVVFDEEWIKDLVTMHSYDLAPNDDGVVAYHVDEDGLEYMVGILVFQGYVMSGFDVTKLEVNEKAKLKVNFALGAHAKEWGAGLFVGVRWL